MNKKIILISIIISFLIIVGFTSYKVIKNHNEKLILVKEKYIIEKAKDCINDKKCNEEKITLEKLYELNYLEKEVNPVTKEYYNEKSYVLYKNNEYIFINLK